MKKILGLAVIATALLPIFSRPAQAEKLEAVVINRPYQAVDFTESVDLSPWDRFSAQAVYDSVTPASHTINSGSYASTTLSVNATSFYLISAQASMTINVSSVTGVDGDYVTLNGIVFEEGNQWNVGATTTTSASNLSGVIDAHPDFEATSSGSTVTVKYALYGTSGNGLPATTSDSTYLPVSAATFTGGLNRQTININGNVFTEGVDFNANISSQTTAHSITNAINTSVSSQTVTASSAGAVVTIRANTPGFKNYYLVSSTGTLAPGVGFPGGIASEIDIESDVFTKASHGFTTGMAILMANVSGTVPTGLVNGTTYYAIKVNENTYKLSATSTGAVAGLNLNITGITNNNQVYMRPLAFSAGSQNGFYWSASNDNTNFTSLSAVTYSSVTYSTAGNSIWDFGTLNYKYLRVNFKAPTAGGINLLIRIFGKQD